MRGACCLDVPILKDHGKRSKARRSRVAQRIAFKRLLHSGNVDRWTDGTNAVFRNPQQCAYVSTAFLDQHNTVLAANERGYVDIVRLPPFNAGCKVRAALGSTVCSNLSVAPNYDGRMEHCKLFGLQNGKAFAVGLPTGEFKVFGVEHASLWNMQASGLKPASVSQVVPHNTPKFITQGWASTRPLRRYAASKERHLSNQILYPESLKCLDEIYDWEQNSFDYGSSTSRLAATRWDFRESSSGNLQAVHIGCSSDMFMLRVLDERTPRSQNDICIDRKMRPGHVFNSVCFASDNFVATSSLHDEGHTISFWDVRMVCKRPSASSTTVPAFPRDTSHGLNSTKHIVFPGRISDCSLTALNNGAIVACLYNKAVLIDPMKGVSTDMNIVTNFPSKSLHAVEKCNGCIALYGLCKPNIDIIPFPSFVECRTGRKRKVSQTSPVIETSLLDCYGLQTELTSLSFNGSGTCLVGGSKDGDLYVWRT